MCPLFMPKKADLRMLRKAGTPWPITAVSFLIKKYLFALRTRSDSHGHHFIKLNPGPERSSSLWKSHSWKVVKGQEPVVRTVVGRSSTPIIDAARTEFPECHKSEARNQDDNGMYNVFQAKKSKKKKSCILIFI